MRTIAVIASSTQGRAVVEDGPLLGLRPERMNNATARLAGNHPYES
jgi:hypothetical protein